MNGSSSPIDLPHLRQADRGAVVQSLIRFARHPAKRWMGSTHPAGSGQLLNADGTVLRDYRRLASRYANGQLADLLAATGPTHCMDGWTYLSRAMECMLSGHPHPARHLAYYAQLRAALSILAHCGIGIFNTINFAINSNGAILRLERVGRSRRGMGTHQAVWAAIEAWAGEAPLAKQFLEAIRIRGVTLDDCVQAVWPSTSPSLLVADIVQDWGLDLRRRAADREDRNVSSYVVHDLNPFTDTVVDRLSLVNEIWKCLEPSAGSGYDSLDRYLLRRFLQRVHYTINNNQRYDQGGISTRYLELDTRVQSLASLDFLTGAKVPDDSEIMVRAGNTARGTVDGMLCRAVLLLRAAVGFTQAAFLDAGLGPIENNVRPWLEVTGHEKGFWPSNSPPPYMSDLWHSVSSAVTDLDTVIQGAPRNQYEWYEWLRSEEIDVRCLSQVERACMWGMCN